MPAPPRKAAGDPGGSDEGFLPGARVIGPDFRFVGGGGGSGAAEDLALASGLACRSSWTRTESFAAWPATLRSCPRARPSPIPMISHCVRITVSVPKEGARIAVSPDMPFPHGMRASAGFGRRQISQGTCNRRPCRCSTGPAHKACGPVGLPARSRTAAMVVPSLPQPVWPLAFKG